MIPTDRPPDCATSDLVNSPFSLNDIPVTPSEVFDSLRSLQHKKSTDINDLSVSFISKFNLEVYKPLAQVLKLSFSQGIVP